MIMALPSPADVTSLTIASIRINLSSVQISLQFILKNRTPGERFFDAILSSIGKFLGF